MNFKFQRADIAMADLTINYQREMVVDFTMPFLDLGKFTVTYLSTYMYCTIFTRNFYALSFAIFKFFL